MTAKENSDARALRLVDALTGMIADGEYVWTIEQLARRAQVTPATAKMAAREWLHLGWLTEVENTLGSGFIVTAVAPIAPNEAAIDSIALLQAMSSGDYRLGRLIYGYGSALAFQEMTELVQQAIYVFIIDQTVRPPNLPPDKPFVRTTKKPTVWGEWKGRIVYRIKRSPNFLRAYQRVPVLYQGVRVPCTSPIRTLIDCWVRPDLAGGEDRVNDAWEQYLTANQLPASAVGHEIDSVLRDSSWASMKTAFKSWLKRSYPSIALPVDDE